MTELVRFTEAANADIDDATNWYAERRVQLSLDFLRAVAKVVDRISRNPLAFPVRVGDVRQANLPGRFPYALWFVANTDGSTVIAALHHRQDPRTIRKRTVRSS